MVLPMFRLHPSSGGGDKAPCVGPWPRPTWAVVVSVGRKLWGLGHLGKALRGEAGFEQALQGWRVPAWRGREEAVLGLG